MNKRDKFKQYAAFALAKLDEEHPDPVVLVPSRIVAELGEEVNKENVLLCERSLSWLEDNNFFKAGRRTGAGDYREGIAQRTFREARLTTLGTPNGNINFALAGTAKAMSAVVECVRTINGERQVAAKSATTHFEVVPQAEAAVILTNLLNSAGVSGYISYSMPRSALSTYSGTRSSRYFL